MENNNIVDNEFVDALKERALSGGEAVSSSGDQIQSLITESQEDIKSAAEKREAGTEASFERQRIEARETGATTKTAFLESRRGFGTSIAMLERINQQTDKSLKDLDLREKEALAIGSMEDASQLRQLKLQALAFQQQSEQQTFQNLLSVSQFQLQQKGDARAEKAQSFQERSSLAQIGLEFGIEITEGETNCFTKF